MAINEQIYQFYSNIVAGCTNTISYAFTSVLLGMIRYEMVVKDDSAYRRYSLETPTQKICCSGKEKLSLTGQILPPLLHCGGCLCLAPWIKYFLYL